MLKLFHKLIEAYTDVYKEKYRKDVQLETSVEWKKMKNMKDLVLEIVVDKRISELKMLSEEESTKYGDMEHICRWKRKRKTFRWC